MSLQSVHSSSLLIHRIATHSAQSFIILIHSEIPEILLLFFAQSLAGISFVSLGGKSHAKPQIVGAIRRRIPAAKHHATVHRRVAPTTATIHAIRA